LPGISPWSLPDAMSDPVNGKFRVIATNDGGKTWAKRKSSGMPPALDGEFGFAASGTCLITAGDKDAWIASGLELVSGAQRLHRYDDYVRTLEARGYPYAPYASYVEAFRRGIPPHGGFAIGLERFVGRLTESPNIREVTLFPRDLHRLAP